MGTWSWTREALVVGSLKSQGLDNKSVIDLFKTEGLDGLAALAGMEAYKCGSSSG
jgi:hypothetical protein